VFSTCRLGNTCHGVFWLHQSHASNKHVLLYIVQVQLLVDLAPLYAESTCKIQTSDPWKLVEAYSPVIDIFLSHDNWRMCSCVHSWNHWSCYLFQFQHGSYSWHCPDCFHLRYWHNVLHIIIEDGRHAGTKGLIDNLSIHFLVTHEHHRLVWRMHASQTIPIIHGIPIMLV
jgi:hypothetical protein